MKISRDDELFIVGIPENTPEAVAAVCRSRLLTAIRELLCHVDTPELIVHVGTATAFHRRGDGKLSDSGVSSQYDDADVPRPDRYIAREPYYTFEQLVLPESVLDDILAAIEIVRVESRVFEDWGLRRIEPFPRTALNFHGPPGTGKTLAAHALAQRLGRPILIASYAEIESKFHGDGPKNVKAIFQAAERDGAILFIDEADSLLSRRLTNITQGSEQAINSMRSQLLICLEQFHGVVIFSTNLVENYDKAFETRVQHVHFPMPDIDCRREIWRRLLVPSLPVDSSVDIQFLAERLDGICGRDIKNAIIDAAVRVAIANGQKITTNDLVSAVERLKSARINTGLYRPLAGKETETLEGHIKAALGRHKSRRPHYIVRSPRSKRTRSGISN